MVISGLSPEMNLKTLKLATAGYYDGLPALGTNEGRAFLDPEWSGILLRAARESGLGAQFGGVHLALDARVIRLARHAGSCPVSIGVSCSADRNVLGKITSAGNCPACPRGPLSCCQAPSSLPAISFTRNSTIG
jgi:fumarate hydratase class I